MPIDDPISLTPRSASALQAKLRGEELTEGQIHDLLADIVARRYPEHEVTAFLSAAARSLTDRETAALARARFALSPKITWDEPVVVDKHSLGGALGNRISMILVPLIAAHGLAIPKTSSRAITSAAGTADAMETVARVDLTVGDVRSVVDRVRGCIAWNGRLNHSMVDDVMNGITRPLGIDSRRWAVASILSKKLAAGSTHVIIDLPYGERAKLANLDEAIELGSLFERIGRELGLVVDTQPSEASIPAKVGVGPALEVRDALAVLSCEPGAPAGLRQKALFFASHILMWDRNLRSMNDAQTRAEVLLTSGKARERFDRIVDAQGRRAVPIMPSSIRISITADRSGIIEAIDSWAITDIARAAGAPKDLGAGLDILQSVGGAVRAGDPLCLIYASSQEQAVAALNMAKREPAYRILA